jgi:hypothetical protein
MAEDEQPEPEGDEKAPKWYRDAIATQAAEMKTLRDQVAQFTKAEVFNTIGVPTSGPGKLFRDTWSGDMSPDSVRAAAEQYGILQALPPETPVEEQAAHSRIAAATATTAETVTLDQSIVEALNASTGGADTMALLESLKLLGGQSF